MSCCGCGAAPRASGALCGACSTKLTGLERLCPEQIVVCTGAFEPSLPSARLIDPFGRVQQPAVDRELAGLARHRPHSSRSRSRPADLCPGRWRCRALPSNAAAHPSAFNTPEHLFVLGLS